MKERGITLIALVITVIVLLILAGAAVSIGLNGDNVFNKANEAKTSWNIKANEENTTVNGYLEYIDQYLGGGDGPVTGTLEVGYDLLADVQNTYKKVTLSISGLSTASPEQLLAALAATEGKSVEDEEAQLNALAQEAVQNNDEGYDTYEEQLADKLEYYGISPYEPITVTTQLNGASVPVNREEFLATQNGTYTVTIRSASNKVGTIDVVIDGEKIGTTKEQSGINEEKFVLPTSADYTDSNGKHARIPTGYYVGTSSTINTVANGLVITSSIDGNGHSTGDEYVWIPVEDINDMVMCKSNASGNVCTIVQDATTGELTCTKHNKSAKTDFCGRLYGEYSNTTDTEKPRIYTTHMNFDNRAQTYADNEDCREPDLVTTYDNDSNAEYITKAGVASANALKMQMQDDFYEMAKSVAKYGGFWIARYETGSSGGSKKGQKVASGYENNNMWYGLYNVSRSINSANNIAKTMIWGSEYDQVIKFIGSQAETGHTDRQLNSYIYPSAYAPLDKMKNIYDLEANLVEWTAETYSPYSRGKRGGEYNNVAIGNFFPASLNFAGYPIFAFIFYTSRATLYVTL